MSGKVKELKLSELLCSNVKRVYFAETKEKLWTLSNIIGTNNVPATHNRPARTDLAKSENLMAPQVSLARLKLRFHHLADDKISTSDLLKNLGII